MRKAAGRIGLFSLALVLALPALAADATKTLWSVTSFGASDYFQEPSDIEVDNARSLIYVVDAGSSRVLLFDFEGKFLRAVGNKGQGPGEFVRPTGAGLLPGGGLAVADLGNNRIETFDAAGKFVRSVTMTEARVADLVFSGGRFFTVPSAGASNYSLNMGSKDDNQPLVNVLDEQGKKVLEISVADFPETHPFIRAIKHRVCLALSPKGRLYLPYFAMNLVHVFETTGKKKGGFSRPLPFQPITPTLHQQRSPEPGIVQMGANIDFVSMAAKFGPDGKLYILTVTDSVAEIRKTNPELKDPYPMRFDVIEPESYLASDAIACDAGVKAFGLMDGGRLVYVYEDAEGELTLKCVRF